VETPLEAAIPDRVAAKIEASIENVDIRRVNLIQLKFILHVHRKNLLNEFIIQSLTPYIILNK
jgi:hypothetical protein